MILNSQRRQQTLARTSTVRGFGLFSGCDAVVEFCPADPDQGIIFERIDLAQPVRIPALIDFIEPQNRCTQISRSGVSVAVIEHVMAALAGLQVDNCTVRINAPEPPICDGSAQPFVEALLQAGIISQDVDRPAVRITDTLVHMESGHVGIGVQPARQDECQIGFVLDYGPGPIPPQSLSLCITPDTFQKELASCRTFVLESEVRRIRAQGLALRATTKNALVFNDDNGLVGNCLRFPDECVRHKILDCVGDFALLGCDVQGQFTATRSGHRLNHEIIRRIRGALAASPSFEPAQHLSTRSQSHLRKSEHPRRAVSQGISAH